MRHVCRIPANHYLYRILQTRQKKERTKVSAGQTKYPQHKLEPYRQRVVSTRTAFSHTPPRSHPQAKKIYLFRVFRCGQFSEVKSVTNPPLGTPDGPFPTIVPHSAAQEAADWMMEAPLRHRLGRRNLALPPAWLLASSLPTRTLHRQLRAPFP